MQKTVFYSWQSDHPSNTNRSLIERALNTAIKAVSQQEIHLEIALDRDTLGVGGSPDIVQTIFDKILKTTVFVADISFVNSTTEKRRIPNPNVLLELGYAANCVGWHQIICIFNTDYGDVKDLPFDLAKNRILTYSVNNKESNTKAEKELAGKLTEALHSAINGSNRNREMFEYIQKRVDDIVAEVMYQLFVMVYGYKRKFSLEGLMKFLDINQEHLELLIMETKIGFTLLKDWGHFETKLTAILNEPFFSSHIDTTLRERMLRLIRTVEAVKVVTSHEQFASGKLERYDDYYVRDKHLTNASLPLDTIALLKQKYDGYDEIDTGIIRKYRISAAVCELTISKDSLHGFLISAQELLKSVNGWIDANGGGLLVDPMTWRFEFTEK